jgi:hypothetical protein
MLSRRWLGILGAALLPASRATCFARNQEPAPAPPPPAASPNPATPPHQRGKQKYSHANDFLVRGTVFTDKALAFPGVRLRIRRATENKFRWETYTDSRGEFAVRVPQGLQYEMVIHAKNFTDQARTIDARSGLSENNNVVFRMEPAGGKK